MEIEKINLRKKYPGVADSAKYIVTLYPKELSIYISAEHLTAEINWPQCCVLCLKPAMPKDFHEISGSTYTQVLTPAVRTVKVKVPYCSECYRKAKGFFHPEKEAVEVMPSSLGPGEVGFKFRNPEYAKLFKRANMKTTRWK